MGTLPDGNQSWGPQRLTDPEDGSGWGGVRRGARGTLRPRASAGTQGCPLTNPTQLLLVPMCGLHSPFVLGTVQLSYCDSVGLK